MTRAINAEGLDLIKEFEGLRLRAYQDSVGVWTIGYGHTKTAAPGQEITEAQAEDLLREDLREAEGYVRQFVTVPLNDNEFSALVSWVFNLGVGNLKRSTMLWKLNAGDRQGAADEMLKWVFAGGVRLDGLKRRRKAERELFLKPEVKSCDDSSSRPWPWLLRHLRRRKNRKK